jgi:transposase
MLLSEGQMSDYKGAALLFDSLPRAKAMIAGKGYDADWFRQALATRKTIACIPSKSNRKVHIPHDPVLYRQRHVIENMFGKLKDWRRIPLSGELVECVTLCSLLSRLNHRAGSATLPCPPGRRDQHKCRQCLAYSRQGPDKKDGIVDPFSRTDGHAGDPCERCQDDEGTGREPAAPHHHCPSQAIGNPRYGNSEGKGHSQPVDRHPPFEQPGQIDGLDHTCDQQQSQERRRGHSARKHVRHRHSPVMPEQ